MGLFGSWFDDLLNGGGSGMPPPMMGAPPQTPATAPSPAQPDAFTQLQQLQQQRANPALWQKIVGGLGGALKDFSNPNAPQNNISSFFGGIKSAQEQNLARSALDQTMTGANGDASGQLPSDLPLKLAKLQSMGVDITPIKTFMETRAAMLPQYERDKDTGNIWLKIPGQPDKLITVGPGKAMSGKEPTVAVNPYGTASPPNGAASSPTQATGGFDPAWQFTLQHEGGYAPKDANGQPVNFGINQGANPDVNVKTLTPDAAKQLALTRYWNPSGAEQLPPGMDAVHFDTSYIFGPAAAKQMLTQSGGDPAKYMQLRAQKMQDLIASNPAKFAPYAKAWAQRNADLSQLVQGQGTQAPDAAAAPPGGARVLYDPGPEVVPIGQASASAQKAYPGAVAMEKNGKPIYPPTSAAESQMFGTPGVAADPNIHGQAYLHTVDPKIATQVKALAEGRMAFPTGFALRSPYWQNMLQAVSQYDPSFDAVNYNARAKTRNDFTSGKSAQNITSFNTAIGHLGTLNSAIDGLNNGNYPTLNRFENYVSQEGGDTRYQVARQKFDTAKQAVTDELTRAFRGSSGNVSDIDKWAATLDAAQSPVALKAAVQQGIALLHSRIDAVGDQYNRGMGTTSDPLKLLSPKAQATIKALEGGSLSAGAPTQVKNSADYNRLPKGAVYLDPNGVQRTKQ